MREAMPKAFLRDWVNDVSKKAAFVLLEAQGGTCGRADKMAQWRGNAPNAWKSISKLRGRPTLTYDSCKWTSWSAAVNGWGKGEESEMKGRAQ